MKKLAILFIFIASISWAAPQASVISEKLKWDKADGASCYEICYGQNENSMTWVTKIGNVKEYEIKLLNVDPERICFFKVRACNMYGCSDWSNTIRWVPFGKNVTIRWSGDFEARWYRVLKASDDGRFIDSQIYEGEETACQDWVEPGVQYTYKIIARDLAGNESEATKVIYSAGGIVSLKDVDSDPPNPPTNVTVLE